MAQNTLIIVPLATLTTFGQSYIRALERRPILIKAITSGFLAALGNVIGQKLKKRKLRSKDIILKLNWRSIVSYSIFGFCVTGPVTHFYLNWLEKYGPRNRIAKLIIDRFLYGPTFLYLTLNVLSILQGIGVDETRKSVRQIYCKTLKANLKIWIICQYINLNFVPLEFRTLITSLISLFWNIYLSGSQTQPVEEK